MHKKEFLDRVQSATGIAERERVEKVTSVVLNSLRGRILPDEADDVAAQLPDDIKELWGTGVRAFFEKFTGPTKLEKEEFISNVADKAQLDEERAEVSVRAVFHTLKDQITPGEAEDVAAELPKKLKILWLES